MSGGGGHDRWNVRVVVGWVGGFTASRSSQALIHPPTHSATATGTRLFYLLADLLGCFITGGSQLPGGWEVGKFGGWVEWVECVSTVG